MALLRASKLSLRANRPLQPSHHAFLRMVLAPRFQVRNVCLVQSGVHNRPASLIAEPAAHPRREVSRHFRRHCQILAACKRTHIDDNLGFRSHRKKRDSKCCANQSKLHFAHPIRCCCTVSHDTGPNYHMHAMSAMGHSRPGKSAPIMTTARCCSNSDHSTAEFACPKSAIRDQRTAASISIRSPRRRERAVGEGR
jgi:hypothetical protein